MTLSTELYVLDEIDPREVFGECWRLLGATVVHPILDERGKYGRPDEISTLSHPPGIGLPAWVLLHYRPGEALRPADEREEDYLHPACWLSVWFDTAWGGQPTRLHARLVAELGAWLDARGISWAWRNEYDGAIYGGDERYTSLVHLLDDGEAGQAWFSGVVRPIIEAEGFGIEGSA